MPGPSSVRSYQSSHQRVPVPSSPALTATPSFTARMGPEIVVTRADLKLSLDAFEQLLNASKAYRTALMTLANASSQFACALEECARQKGAAASSYSLSASPGEQLLAAAGLHHLMGNHNQLLGDSFYRQFEVPLMDEYDTHKARVAERQLQYEKATQDKAKMIRECESRNYKMGKKKLRDLTSFRKALMELQSHVNDLDNLKVEHYSEVYEYEQEMWELIANKTSKVIKSEMDVFDKIATKGTSDPVLEAMQLNYPDPFGAYAQREGEIFSILKPLSVLGPSSALTKTSQATPSRADLSQPDFHHSSTEEEQDEPVTPTQQLNRKLSMIHEDSPSKGNSKELNKKEDMDDWPQLDISRRSAPNGWASTESSPTKPHIQASDTEVPEGSQF